MTCFSTSFQVPKGVAGKLCPEIASYCNHDVDVRGATVKFRKQLLAFAILDYSITFGSASENRCSSLR